MPRVKTSPKSTKLSAKRPHRDEAATNKPRKGQSVRIRMYCQGLGDCFLLTFPRKRGSGEFHMLIDCGLILGTPNADQRMRQVVDDIIATTGGTRAEKGRSGKPGTIDLLVATHEHWDHVSGFVQLKELFEQRLKIQQTWLAWTEDPHDKQARKLRQEREEKKQKLALALEHFRSLGLNDANEGPDSVHAQLAGLSSFFGVDLGAAAETALEGMGKTAQAMEFLRKQHATFLSPGEKPPALDIPAGIDIFVLGPPTDEKLLKKDLPSKGGHETYEEDGHASSLTSLLGLDVPEGDGKNANQPFDERMSMPLSAAVSDPYYAQKYDNGLDEHPSAWRRIDDIGMFAATDLALQLDADTNNTSLVLAIRLPGDKVLLFPGDAQVGNWESWHQVKLHDNHTTAKDLLAATVVYKVGHHGSHNATLSTLGLDLMRSTDLIALLPVDEDIAHNKKGWTRMPFVPLMHQLRKRTQGRILRVDHERRHPDTDARSSESNGAWAASAEKFATEPKRSLYLETFVKWK